VSYDLEVRSDDRYSQSVPKSRVLEHLHALGARPTSSGDFLLYGDAESGQRIEIDLGHEGSDEGEAVNYVGLGVPYAFLSATGSRVLDVAFDIAARLQWRVYDPQVGRYIGETDRESALAVQSAGSRACDQVADIGARAERGFWRRVLERLIRQTKFMIVVATMAFGLIGVYAGREAGPRGVQDPRPFVGRVLAVAMLAIVLRPLLLELLHQRDRPGTP
jgi:hypothetical protein